MAESLTLDPDADNISWIAYYNISEYIDSNNYNPQDLNNPVNAGGLTLYDNGVKFKYTNRDVNRDFIIRAGNKKWITAHMIKKDTYTQDSKTDISQFKSVNSYSDLSYSDLKGGYDIMPWDANAAGATKLEENTLYKAIKDCLDQSSFWDSSNYDPNDLGLYHYSFGDSKVTVYCSRDSNSYEFTYTPNTTIKEAYLAASLYGDTPVQGGETVTLSLEGSRLGGNEGGSDYVAVDITEIARNTNSIDVRLNGSADFGRGGYGSVYCILIWK